MATQSATRPADPNRARTNPTRDAALAAIEAHDAVSKMEDQGERIRVCFDGDAQIADITEALRPLQIADMVSFEASSPGINPAFAMYDSDDTSWMCHFDGSFQINIPV